MRQVALVLLAASFFAPAAHADPIWNVSPPDGATVSSEQPVTFSWDTTLTVDPVFGGYVNLVVLSGGSPVVDETYRCPSYPVQKCPSSATAGPFAPGDYSWYVRWWVFYEDRPAQWVPSTATSFTAATPLPPPPPPNQPPNPRFTYLPASPHVAEEVRFDGSPSSDPDGTIASYNWSFGDGNGASGSPLVGHAYARPGMYTATLVVTDDKGATAETSATVTVEPAPNQLPVARFTFTPAAPLTGEAVSFDASSSSDPDGTVASYAWTFGDGGSAGDASSGATHAFAAAGAYTVTLVVTDDRGGTAQASLPVTVAAPPPARDTTAPRITAVASAGRHAAMVRLRFRATDDSGSVSVVASVRRAGRVLGTVRADGLSADGALRSLAWRAQARAQRLTFCVRATDGARNASSQSCAPLEIR